MNFKVSLDKEQMNEIANITADKVLETVKYCKTTEEWNEREKKEYKIEIQRRDSMLVQKDFLIDGLKERLREARAELKELKG
ncbi:hypothetical protein [Clostridium estertheticum]|uniref:hypothetical protein n=1 Tax=Clostridium estertheticum TaxID=238834 RepID=UPI001C0B2AA4|nr:hypothetical protein [Clostridium estertheticum]MBU3186562.1 hypothetical protein [Clostridium estertheticum]